MSNKYGYNGTYDDLVEEEDRECMNDLLRAQTSYYKTLTNINLIILNTLQNMNSDELKNTLMNNGLRIPVKSIKE